MKWILLIIAGFFETGFTYCMGNAQNSSGKTSFFWWCAFALCMATSLLLMYRAVSGVGGIPLGSAYAVWTGIGAAGAVIVGIVFFREEASFWRIFFLSTLIISIAGLKFFAET